LKKLITHKFPLDKLQEGLETCLDRSKAAVKVIIKP
jgi:threonine dehydrogenase-like Zn-dependent dehydrogenase